MSASSVLFIHRQTIALSNVLLLKNAQSTTHAHLGDGKCAPFHIIGLAFSGVSIFYIYRL